MKVFILCTCRKPELLPYTLLVFRTLRIGFPTAEVHVDINAMSISEWSAVAACCQSVNASHSDTDTIHHRWIEQLIEAGSGPFYLLDTDVCFYDNFEDQDFSGSALAGWRIPEWRDDFSRSITRARLHTSLLYVDPVMVREKLEEFKSELPPGPFTPFVNPFYPLVVPFKHQRFFYDTCSLLYHAVGGRAFSDEQLDKYIHLNFGTISDLVLPRLPENEQVRMTACRMKILENPLLGRGAWREQTEYFLSKPV